MVIMSVQNGKGHLFTSAGVFPAVSPVKKHLLSSYLENYLASYINTIILENCFLSSIKSVSQ